MLKCLHLLDYEFPYVLDFTKASGEIIERHLKNLGMRESKYHELKHEKFGEEGNKYFRHATGQIYAISKDLATYISINWPILHRYANEDICLGSWLLGLKLKMSMNALCIVGTLQICFVC
ncbi:Beta-1,3-galactosyltransferase 7 [Glycine soja]